MNFALTTTLLPVIAGAKVQPFSNYARLFLTFFKPFFNQIQNITDL
jgi:hypothetical protein